MHVAELIRELFPDSRHELQAGGLGVVAVAAQFGTPLFLYDGAVLQRSWDRLRSTFPPVFDIFYSVKANPNPHIAGFFLAQGAGLEIASAGELYQAQHTGCPADRIVFAGPGKSPSELELALRSAIGEIHAESMLELERIALLATSLRTAARVAIRVNPDGEAQGGAMRMGGKPAPFGIDEESLDAALDFVVSQPVIDFRGIHLFTGTQILDPAILIAQYRKALQVARHVGRRTGRHPASIDFGGGLGIPYFENDRPLDLAALRTSVLDVAAEVAGDSRLAGTRLIIEPGRFLVGEAGIYLVRVLDIKRSRGKKFVIVDGGMNHHLAASGNLGQTIKRNFPLAVANRLDQPAVETVDIVGPLCTPLDVLARSVPVPRIAVGDLIAVLQSGAYARAASPLGFLSHPSPPEVLIRNGEPVLIRRGGMIEDWLRDVVIETEAVSTRQSFAGVS